MMSTIRPELARRNKYWISKYKFYELKYFCLQYSEWKNIYYYLDDARIPSLNTDVKSSDISNPTEALAISKSFYSEKIKMVEETVKEADTELYEYILKAITQDLSFNYLDTVLNIPCSRGTYYNRYRRFFWLLSKKR